MRALTAVLHLSFTAVVEGIASRAIDGNAATNWHAGSCTHTNSQSNPWCLVFLCTVCCMAVMPLDVGPLRSCVASYRCLEVCRAHVTCMDTQVACGPGQRGYSAVCDRHQPWVGVLAHHGCDVTVRRGECWMWMQGLLWIPAFEF